MGVFSTEVLLRILLIFIDNFLFD